MLVLTRKIDEEVWCRLTRDLPAGSEIRIKIIEVRASKEGGRVRLGIDAPDSVTIHRQEIWVKIEGEMDEIANMGETE